jgi:hypothetical protein
MTSRPDWPLGGLDEIRHVYQNLKTSKFGIFRGGIIAAERVQDRWRAKLIPIGASRGRKELRR